MPQEIREELPAQEPIGVFECKDLPAEPRQWRADIPPKRLSHRVNTGRGSEEAEAGAEGLDPGVPWPSCCSVPDERLLDGALEGFACLPSSRIADRSGG